MNRGKFVKKRFNLGGRSVLKGGRFSHVRRDFRRAQKVLIEVRATTPGKHKSEENSIEKRGFSAVRAGKTHHKTNGNGVSMHKTMTPVLFRPLSAYENSELRAVKFRNEREADKAVVRIMSSTDLKQMPFHFADGLTFILPAEALPFLEGLKLQFTVSTVLSMDDLDPEERAEIRRCHSL